MLRRILISLFTLMVLPISLSAQITLIPMDETQTDHLKAYGIAFKALEMGRTVEWLLNYRAGSFVFDADPELDNLCLIRGVYAEHINSADLADIYRVIEVENMERVMLEKAPAIAVYSPQNVEPWDDAVMLALTYADIKYDMIWDEEV
ncbi:MAG: asparagine synthetase B, partial [Candidatus Zixiibacteriota bacterium]